MEPPYTPKKQPKVEFVPFDGLKFKTVFWTHPENVKYLGRVVYVHGYDEIVDVYVQFFDLLSDLGYDIFAFNQRGVPETSPESGYGRTNEFHTFNDLEFMMKKNLDEVRAKNPSEKLILMGHLMGGGIVLNYGIKGKYVDDLRAIIATAPQVFLHPKTDPNVFLKLLNFVTSRLYPNYRIKSVPDTHKFTSNEPWRKYIEAIITTYISAGLYNDMCVRGERLAKPEEVAKFHDVPVLLLHGTADEVNWIKGSKIFINLLKSDKEFVAVDGARHSMAVEVDSIRDLVLNKISEFLSKRP